MCAPLGSVGGAFLGVGGVRVTTRTGRGLCWAHGQMGAHASLCSLMSLAPQVWGPASQGDVSGVPKQGLLGLLPQMRGPLHLPQTFWEWNPWDTALPPVPAGNLRRSPNECGFPSSHGLNILWPPWTSQSRGSTCCSPSQ